MNVRPKAAALFDRGESQAEVARACAVSRSTASRWYRLWKAGTLDARRRGRPPKVETETLRAIDRVLAAPPRNAGFDLNHWSLAAAAALIEQRTGVSYHRRHVGRLLRRMGWIVPPLDRHDEALRRRTVRDVDGNALNLIQRVKP